MSWLSEAFGGGGNGGGGSTKTTTKTTTTTNITDKRQVAEGEYVAGPDSVMSLPYSVAIAEGGTYSVSGVDAGEIVGNVLSNMGSTVGQLLGIQGQMAQGMFELSPKIIAEVKGFEASAKPQTERTMLYAIAGIVALFIFMRK